MKFIDLFAGIGGFRYGLERTGNNSNNRREKTQGQLSAERESSGTQNSKGRVNGGKSAPVLPYECVWSNEWDKYAASIYRKHYGECDTRDIRTVDAGEIPKFNLLCGGFPCQSFSVAGKGKGFDDTRGTLFFEIARILSERRPEHLLLENVKGLLTNDSGRTFQRILRILADLGYRVEWQVLNSKHFGVPQNRERVFIVGHLRGECGRKIFPIGGIGQQNLKEITMNLPDAQRIYDSNGVAKTLKGEGGGQGAKTGLYAINPRNFNGKSYVKGKKAIGLSQPSGNNQTLVGNATKIRRLTPVECERLQGFPDNYTKYGIDEDGNEVEISDTQRYKVLGNAVSTPVIEVIGSKLFEEGEDEERN